MECTLRTEGLLALPFTAFLSNLAQSTTKSGGSSVRTYTSSLTAVELGSSGAVNADVGIDVFQRRFTKFSMSIIVMVGGAVVEVLAPGDVAPPLLISVQGSLNTYGGPAFSRCLVDSKTVRLVWQTNAYVLQSNRYFLQAPIAPDTTLETAVMGASKYDVVWQVCGAVQPI